MSSQLRNDRRGRSRFPGPPGRQEWVRRGSPSNTAVNLPSSFSSNPNGNVGSSNYSSSQLDSQDRENFSQLHSRDRGHFSSRGHPGGSSNQRVVSLPSSFSLNRIGNDGDSNYSSAALDGRDREHFAGRGHSGRPSNQRREKERGRVRIQNKEGRVLMESNLPQLVQEIQEKLVKGTVECMICYDMVGRNAAIWSCSSCYSIFHLHCIKKWARAPTSIDMSAEKNQGFNWRCPGCQSVQLMALKEIQYVCFCKKRSDPPSDLYLTPHSCGEPCGKPLEREVLTAGNSEENICPHVCVLQCHPGPCPPCKAFAPPRSCPCGKKIITTRCSDRKSVLTCGQRCDKLLDCWRHRCERLCHVDHCDPCQVLINASCFCRKKVEVLLCGDMAVKGEVKEEDGVFSCISTCGKKLVCGNHPCTEICHPGPCGECDLLPSRTKTCCCGKTNLQEERKSCLDPIPTCQQICGKPLPCGIHQCKEMCHPGDCEPCFVLVTQKCRCGLTCRTVECYKTTPGKEKFVCDKPCGRKKNCGRHRCSERCCPLSNSSYTVTGDWDPHFCSMACGKKLRCGQHSCASLCHSGHCPPCLETIFTDLTCACGRTSIPPPLPCGTTPPSCQLPCSVDQPCGHPSSHSCHFGDCPPCSVPIAKECIGGHVVLRNIPCGSKDIKCNKLCGKTRQCGLHACARSCHPPPCDSSCGSVSVLKASCRQICGAPRRDCRHTCSAVCHPSAPCPDIRCDFPVTITCSCGRIGASVPCDSGGSSGGGFRADTVHEACVIQKLPVSLQPVEANGKKIPLGQRKLMCDDECTKLERKRVLADAFDMSYPNLDALHFGEKSGVSELLSDVVRRDPKWVLSVEERCKLLVLGKSKGSGSSSLRIHVFCPMLKEKRDVVRVIAERWKLSVNASGWEPKRFIVVHVTAKSKAPPRVLGSKPCTPVNMLQLPAFDPLVDMDPRLVVCLLDLPRDADISALVLRFGGECELVWLNDKNALAVFSDPARAATAMRRLDHGSVYNGVVVRATSSSLGVGNAWGGVSRAKEGGGALKGGNPWKKVVVQEPGQSEDESWGDGDVQAASVVWKGKEGPIVDASVNRWNVLDPYGMTALNSSGPCVDIEEEPGKWMGSGSVGGGANISGFSLAGGSEDMPPEVEDDWEKAYELVNERNDGGGIRMN